MKKIREVIFMSTILTFICCYDIDGTLTVCRCNGQNEDILERLRDYCPERYQASELCDYGEILGLFSSEEIEGLRFLFREYKCVKAFTWKNIPDSEGKALCFRGRKAHASVYANVDMIRSAYPGCRLLVYNDCWEEIAA